MFESLYSGVKMITKRLSSIKNQNYNKSVIQLITWVAFCLMYFQLNAAEVTTGAKSLSGDLNGSSKKPSDFSKGGSISSEPRLLDDGGIVRETDFSRETGTSRETEGIMPAGFSNKIIFTTSVAHDSNPALDDSRKKSVWIYSLIPRLLLDYTGEVNSFYLDAALLVQRHSNEEILTDREDPALKLGWNRTYESGFFGLYANYLESSTRSEELRTAGVFSGNAGNDNTQRVRQYGARWEHMIAPRWSLSTNGEYTEEAFSGGGVSLIDSSAVGVRSKLNYAYTERLDTYLQIGYAQIRPDQTFNDTDLARLALGADYQLSEALKVSSRAGTYHLSGRQSDTDWEAGVQASYQVGRMGYEAELNRELGAASVGGFQKSDTFRLGWFYDISEFDKLNVNYAFVKFKQDAQVGLLKSETQQISAFYDRILRGNWKGQANITFRENKRDIRSDGNIVGVSLIYDGLSF